VLFLLQKILETFELKLETDVVATISEGAVVMKKFGTLSTTIQQLCYSHELHLAVTKVFYGEKLKGETSKTRSIESE
jgi:hypothetical protein